MRKYPAKHKKRIRRKWHFLEPCSWKLNFKNSFIQSPRFFKWLFCQIKQWRPNRLSSTKFCVYGYHFESDRIPFCWYSNCFHQICMDILVSEFAPNWIIQERCKVLIPGREDCFTTHFLWTCVKMSQQNQT